MNSNEITSQSTETWGVLYRPPSQARRETAPERRLITKAGFSSRVAAEAWAAEAENGGAQIERVYRDRSTQRTLPENTSTKWTIYINGSAIAIYDTKQEAEKIVKELLPRVNPKVRVEIIETPGDKFRIIPEALNQGNQLPDIPMVTTYMLYTRKNGKWVPLARFPSEEQAREYGRESEQQFKVSRIQYPQTKYE
jgi:hypothetical protein